MKFDVFEKMYELLWECIYNILAIFGVTKDEEGNLKDAE